METKPTCVSFITDIQSKCVAGEKKEEKVREEERGEGWRMRKDGVGGRKE